MRQESTFVISDLTWPGSVMLLSFVSFSGNLQLDLDPYAIEEGEEIVLFEFSQVLGNSPHWRSTQKVAQ